MKTIENKIIDYMTDFFTPTELGVMKKTYYHNYSFDDTVLTDPEYIQLSNLYKTLFGIAEEGRYRVEVNTNCSDLIKELFKRYVDEDTFVVSTIENHPNVDDLIKNIPENKKILFCAGSKEQDNPDLINKIFDAYKKSGCKKVFVFICGVIVGFSYIIEQSFFNKLKNIFTQNNIPHIMALDDCQGIFYVQRDYSIFDAIFATAHTLFLGFSMGILFTRLDKKLGFINKEGLKRFSEKLEILNKHKNKIMQFDGLLTEYFQPVLDGKIFNHASNTPSDYFTIQTENLKTFGKYINELMSKYNFIFNRMNVKKSWFRIRFHESIIQEPEYFLQGLNRTKQIFGNSIRYNELGGKTLKENEEIKMYDMVATNLELENKYFNYDNADILQQAKEMIIRRFGNSLDYIRQR